jgi:DtxR family transcriptional regulator, Mn-dependent transcriptional regulator
MKATLTEENYLKVIYMLSLENEKIANLDIADALVINPATVTEMLKKLHDKKLIQYSRAEGASLTKTGSALALLVIRKHRLWETFLVEKMNFSWDEVHDIAEQLEHIQSDKLLEELDRLLEYPKFDPHGDPIPDKNGQIPDSKAIALADGKPNKAYRITGVTNHSSAFLQFLNKLNLSINDSILIREIQDFDKSMTVLLKGEIQTIFSNDVSRNLLVVPR